MVTFKKNSFGRLYFIGNWITDGHVAFNRKDVKPNLQKPVSSPDAAAAWFNFDEPSIESPTEERWNSVAAIPATEPLTEFHATDIFTFSQQDSYRHHASGDLCRAYVSDAGDVRFFNENLLRVIDCPETLFATESIARPAWVLPDPAVREYSALIMCVRAPGFSDRDLAACRSIGDRRPVATSSY